MSDVLRPLGLELSLHPLLPILPRPAGDGLPILARFVRGALSCPHTTPPRPWTTFPNPEIREMKKWGNLEGVA